jgi:hypothetical protein
MNTYDERACCSGSFLKSTNARAIHGTMTMLFSFVSILSFSFAVRSNQAFLPLLSLESNRVH